MVGFRKSSGPLMFVLCFLNHSHGLLSLLLWVVDICYDLLMFVHIKCLHEELDEEMCCMVSPVFLVNYMSHPGHFSRRYCRCPLSVAGANRFQITTCTAPGANCTIKKIKSVLNTLCISWRCTAFFVEQTVRSRWCSAAVLPEALCWNSGSEEPLAYGLRQCTAWICMWVLL